jgi:hypothetical protein
MAQNDHTPSTNIAVITAAELRLWLVLSDDEIGFSQAWVVLGLVVFALVVLVGVLLQSRAAIAAQRAADDSNLPEATRHPAQVGLGKLDHRPPGGLRHLGHDLSTGTLDEPRTSNPR